MRVVLLILVLWILSSVCPAFAAESTQPVTRITVVLAGNVLMHRSVVASGLKRKSGAYDFTSLFAPVAPYLRSADYTIAHLETPLAGAERGYGGYPRFNAPAALAANLRASGVKMVALANNHMLDMGRSGVARTLQTLDAAGVAHLGTVSKTSEQQPCIITVHGIKLAVLNATASTGSTPPAGNENDVNVLDTARLLSEAEAARRHGAELVIALLHNGQEYQRGISDAQRQLAGKLIAGGVDVLIGTHPHVVQPIERLTVQRHGAPFTGLVAYALGNFVSSQRRRYCDSGIILYLLIEKSAAGTRVRNVVYLPVWVQQGTLAGRTQFRLLPLLPGKPPKSDLPLSAEDHYRLHQVQEELAALLNKPAQAIKPLQNP